MSQQLTFELKKSAKSKGGDKYVCKTMKTFSIYFPQSISREGKEAKKEITIMIVSPKESDSDLSE